jgi:hypothetical protein
MCGMPGSTPSRSRIAATGVQAFGAAELEAIWPDRSSSLLTRVTMEAAAIDSSSAGIWATSASPMAQDDIGLRRFGEEGRG